MDENEITQRLRDAGDQPVPGEVRASHLSQMHATTPAAVHQPKRFGRLAVAAAAFVGFAVGSTGLAMAGALPDPVQQVAHDVLSVVQVQVPDRPDNHGKCVSQVANDPAVSAQDKKAVKDERCPKGKPDHAGRGKGAGNGRPDHAGTPGGPNAVPHQDDPCKGPPPWAGNEMTPAEKDAARAERAAACGQEVEVEPEATEPTDQVEG